MDLTARCWSGRILPAATVAGSVPTDEERSGQNYSRKKCASGHSTTPSLDHSTTFFPLLRHLPARLQQVDLDLVARDQLARR